MSTAQFNSFGGVKGFCYDLCKGVGNENPTLHVQTACCALERRDLPLESGVAKKSLGLWDPSPMFGIRLWRVCVCVCVCV